MSVFVTDGNQRSTLALTRSLGRAGIRVTVGECSAPNLAGSSRYCAREVVYPSPTNAPGGFQSFLEEEVRRGGYQVLLPMTDETTSLVSAVAPCLAPTLVPFPPGERVGAVQDKGRVLRLAAELGIGCPVTYMLDDSERLEDVANRIAYPAVIKPRFSRVLSNGRWATGEVRYAAAREDLITKYRQMQEQIPRPLVQEMIHGEGRGAFILLWNGELKAAFCHRRLREKPPSGGVSVYRESVALDESLLQQSYKLLKAMGWQGVAMVEFKVDEHGRAKLMEVNGRFWGSLQLAIDAGMNFPLLLYRLAIGKDVPPQFTYRIGVKTRWLLGDLDHLLIRLRDRASNGWERQQRSRLRACLDFLKFYEKDMHYEVLKLNDPRPGWVEARQWLRALLRGGEEGRGAH